MAFGFQVFNSAGEVVVNDTDYTIQMKRELTKTGTAVSGVPGSVWLFDHTFLDTSNFLFFNLSVGDAVAVDPFQPTRFYANKSSMLVREVQVSRLITPGQGYGLEVYDMNGNCTYSASENLIAVKNWWDSSPNTGNTVGAPGINVTTNGEGWFAIPRPGFWTFAPDSSRYDIALGVERDATNHIKTGVLYFDEYADGQPSGYTASIPFSVISAL